MKPFLLKPTGDTHGYEILYFGVNLILMFDYRLSFDIKVIKNSGENSNKIEVLIISTKDVSAWKKGNDSGNKDRRLHYSNSGERINDNFNHIVELSRIFLLHPEVRIKCIQW